MKSGSHTAILFFILNPPIRVTSLPQSRLGVYKRRNSPYETRESGLDKGTGKFSGQ
ncbi:MAG: hypothetical protein WCA34_18475 [Candidatus Acidiferrales bacterium]